VRCAIEVQNGMVERNADVPPEGRIEYRVGIHVGDVVELTIAPPLARHRRREQTARRKLYSPCLASCGAPFVIAC
jgi:hypothetical protein